MAWADRAEQLCYAGETVRERFVVGSNTLVVTSHRLLVFTPEGAGAQYRPVDRPNVEGVSIGTGSADGLFAGRTSGLLSLLWTVQAAIIGLTLLTISLLIDFASFVPTAETTGIDDTQPGMGDALAPLESLRTLFVVIDALILLGGLLALLAAVIGGVVYARGSGINSRENRMLIISVAGDEDLELPVSGVGGAQTALCDELNAALAVEGEEATAEEPVSVEEGDSNQRFSERATRVPPRTREAERDRTEDENQDSAEPTADSDHAPTDEA